MTLQQKLERIGNALVKGLGNIYTGGTIEAGQVVDITTPAGEYNYSFKATNTAFTSINFLMRDGLESEEFSVVLTSAHSAEEIGGSITLDLPLVQIEVVSDEAVKIEELKLYSGDKIVQVYHYWRPKMQAPFCVWAEDGESTAFDADNKKAEQAIGGYVDYYTKTEYDPALDAVQDVLSGLAAEMPFGWRLESVQYEDETNLIHYQWTWSVA